MKFACNNLSLWHSPYIFESLTRSFSSFSSRRALLLLYVQIVEVGGESRVLYVRGVVAKKAVEKAITTASL